MTGSALAHPGQSRPSGSADAAPSSSGSHRVELLSFERVYADHFDFIWRSVRGLGIPPAVVDDVTQDVFIIVHRKLDSLESPAAIRSWLFGIARRVCKDHRRSVARKGLHLELDAEREVDDGHDPQQHAASRQALDVVKGYVDKLDDDRRALFFLALVEGLSIAETADTLGLNVNTTYSRVRVMRKELSELLDANASGARGEHD